MRTFVLCTRLCCVLHQRLPEAQGCRYFCVQAHACEVTPRAWWATYTGMHGNTKASAYACLLCQGTPQRCAHAGTSRGACACKHAAGRPAKARLLLCLAHVGAHARKHAHAHAHAQALPSLSCCVCCLLLRALLICCTGHGQSFGPSYAAVPARRGASRRTRGRRWRWYMPQGPLSKAL